MRHPSRLFFCVGKHVVDPSKPAEDENVRSFPKFSVEAFLPSQIEGCEAHGRLREVKPGKLWEVQSPSTFRDAWWLSDEPEAKARGNTSLLYLRWRLSRYLKAPHVGLQIQPSPFDACTSFFRRQKPWWGEIGPMADDLRAKLMAAIHQLHQTNPALAMTISTHFEQKGDSYTPGLIMAATQGERKYTHDPLIQSILDQKDTADISDGILHPAEEPSPAEIEAALPGEPTGNVPPAVEAIRERTERK